MMVRIVMSVGVHTLLHKYASPDIYIFVHIDMDYSIIRVPFDAVSWIHSRLLIACISIVCGVFLCIHPMSYDRVRTTHFPSHASIYIRINRSTVVNMQWIWLISDVNIHGWYGRHIYYTSLYAHIIKQKHPSTVYGFPFVFIAQPK